jgi:hypothetical protein
MSRQYKSKIDFPAYYSELSVDQQLFIDNLFDDTADEKLEKLRTAYRGVMEHIGGFVDSLDKVDSILYPIE